MVTQKAEMKALAWDLWSHLNTLLGKDLHPHSFTGCWQHSVPCGLLAGSPTMFLVMWVSWKRAGREVCRQRLVSKIEVTAFCNLIAKWYCLDFVMLCWLKASATREEDYTRLWLSGVGSHLRGWPSQQLSWYNWLRQESSVDVKMSRGEFEE